MSTPSSLIQRDLKHIWHPCSQMKDFEQFPPIIIEKAKGSYLHTNKGVIIDAISSWWCKSLGHNHPAVVDAIQKQLHSFEHVIGANTTHPKLIELGEKLSLLTHKQHVFFASDGSSSVEIALKLVLQAHFIKGNTHKQQIIKFQNAYHGETLATLSTSDLGLYRSPFSDIGLKTYTLKSIPYTTQQNSLVWNDCNSHWDAVKTQLDEQKGTTAAIIFEPIVQGAAGMLMYSADFLHKLAHYAKENDIYLVADEIMTGIGRTGEWLACNHAKISPDIICLSKGLTSGSIPFSCTMIDSKIYDLFYDDYASGKSFLHSHTYSCNALGVSAALATINTIENEDILLHSKTLGQFMLQQMTEIGLTTGQLSNIRSIGAIVAADLNPHPFIKRVGYLISQQALENGALIRPIGNTLYWLPPLNTDTDTILKLAEITFHAINKVYKL